MSLFLDIHPNTPDKSDTENYVSLLKKNRGYNKILNELKTPNLAEI